jgi:hypothetical protein
LGGTVPPGNHRRSPAARSGWMSCCALALAAKDIHSEILCILSLFSIDLRSHSRPCPIVSRELCIFLRTRLEISRNRTCFQDGAPEAPSV